MKPLLIFCTFIFLFGINADAQATNDTIYEIGVTPPVFTRKKTVSNHVGSNLVICDKVYSYKVIKDKIKRLTVGADDPDQIITVILMGECFELDVKKMIGQKVCFKGIISLRGDKTHMIVSRLEQITGYKQYEQDAANTGKSDPLAHHR